MTDHVDIQDPEKFSDLNYQLFEKKLFSAKTDTEELEKICMTLAHLPTRRAQDLLAKFQKSNRADEVEWLQFAIEEGKFNYLLPENDEEKKDFIALKLMMKNEKRNYDLQEDIFRCDYGLKEHEIELEALLKMQKEENDKHFHEDIGYKITAVKDIMTMNQSKIVELMQEIKMNEKINSAISGNIKTEKYRDLDPYEIEDFHIYGEDESDEY